MKLLYLTLSLALPLSLAASCEDDCAKARASCVAFVKLSPGTSGGLEACQEQHNRCLISCRS